MVRITLLTDFGTVDGYAAAMAGVLAAGAPEARLESASHEVAPGDVVAAAVALSRYAFLYPEGTVHVVVVDPGVGTSRRALAGVVEGRFFVAPDNGVLTRIMDRPGRWVEISVPDWVRGSSDTFHGRDIFAPAAAALARGASLDTLGPNVPDPIRMTLPEPSRGPDGGRGEVVQVDRFGNLITNIPADWLPQGDGRVDVAGQDVPLGRTYGHVAEGELVALVGSLGVLEISVRNGSAADRLGAGRGAEVTVRGAG